MDAYRILGVRPSADEAVIRAAYLALMKRFHPDQPGADVERAKEIAAAYRLLGDPARRASYDRQLAEQRMTMVGMPLPPPMTRKTGRTSFFALSVVAVGLLVLVVSRTPSLPGAAEQPAKKVAAVSAPFPEPVLVPPRPLVEEEDAAEIAPVAVTEPVAEDLPPPERDLAAAGERIKPAEPRRRVVAAAPVKLALGPADGAAARAAQPAVRADRSEPQGIDLKALERHQTIFYNQSFLAGDEGRRARLLESRLAFLKRLEGCGSDPCRRDAYLARNQEIAGIMSR